MITHIAILGVGLIGGSFAKVIRKKWPKVIITGFDTPAVLQKALALDVITNAADSAGGAVKSADLVILATPVQVSINLLNQIAGELNPGCIVTDVGSVKSPIVDEALKILPTGVTFIGGHPMAGASIGGVENADDFLFENATWVLCPPAENKDQQQLQSLIKCVELTGARILILDANRHDKIAAMVSHLPQLLAVALTNLVAGENQGDPAFLQLAAGGFRDMTRIASSPFPMWGEIIGANQNQILSALDQMGKMLVATQKSIKNNELNSLSDSFESAAHVRNTIPRSTKGFLSPLVDITVFAKDEPGFLMHLTRIIYDAGVNIKDMELLKIREGTGGAFRLGFASLDEANQAISTLQAAGYRASLLD